MPGFNFCNVSTTPTPRGSDDVVYTKLWLPLSAWNGRFVATGDRGFVAGSESSLLAFVEQGYASAYTDAGLTLNSRIDPSNGYFAAQGYPDDFDGVLANSPAINTPQVSPTNFWPSVVMANVVAPTQCIFDTYLDAMATYCDRTDGVLDGLISEP